MKNNIVLISIIVAFVFGAGGFLGGMKYQQTKRGNVVIRGGNGQMMRFSGQNSQGVRQNFRPVAGEISAADDSSITVKLADGSSKIILLSESTTVNKATEGSKEDLTIGARVSVFGTENADGSITAQNIQLGALNRQLP